MLEDAFCGVRVVVAIGRRESNRRKENYPAFVRAGMVLETLGGWQWIGFQAVAASAGWRRAKLCGLGRQSALVSGKV